MFWGRPHLALSEISCSAHGEDETFPKNKTCKTSTSQSIFNLEIMLGPSTKLICFWILSLSKNQKILQKKGDTWTPTRLETKNTVCPWRPGRRGRAQSLTVRGKSPQRTPLVGSCLPNQGVSSKQGAPLPRRASTEQTVSSPGQLDSARATSSRVAKARP